MFHKSSSINLNKYEIIFGASGGCCGGGSGGGGGGGNATVIGCVSECIGTIGICIIGVDGAIIGIRPILPVATAAFPDDDGAWPSCVNCCEPPTLSSICIKLSEPSLRNKADISSNVRFLVSGTLK
ncbi:hypothetical protein DERF_008399 [Dermatophagoides farinae]|uniref:Uncharacterized protein n=1 Tax=Dermatophagoides farinae TaxID=6954 RepID=A0A922L5F7_DERFA|nr:hypothetical protein DERF_008399 [Dermatophagoides farinae]